jgi:hypothetical protein
MRLSVCSILGMLLVALSNPIPALAEGTARSSDEEKVDQFDRSEVEAKDRGDDSNAAKKKKKKAKGKKRGKGKSEESSETADTTAETAAVEPPPPEPQVWEAPPQEAEQPPPPPPPPPPQETEARARPWSVGLIAGWGFETDRRSTVLGASAYNLGFGLRGGYTLDVNLYVGAFAMYFLGGSQTGSNANTADFNTTVSASSLLAGVEVGYDWWVGPLIVRPSIEIGAAIGFTNSRSPAIQSGTLTEVLFGPGITVVHPWDEYFLGGEARADIVTGDGVSAILVAGTFGMRF